MRFLFDELESSSAPSIETEVDSTDTSTVLETLYWLGCVFMVVLCCCLSRRKIPDERYHMGHIFRQQVVNAEEQRRQRERLSDPTERKAAIERALIVKRVNSIGPHGALMLGDPSEENSEKGSRAGVSTHSYPHPFHAPHANQEDTEEAFSRQSQHQESECAICFEKYEVGDYVAWSRKATTSLETVDASVSSSTECRHVYHHECILSWFRDTWHLDCPSCRKVILEEDITVDETVSQSHRQDNSHNAANGPFQIVNGLISIVRQSLIGSSVDVPSYSIRRVFSMGARPTRKKSVGFSSQQEDEGIMRHSFAVRPQPPVPLSSAVAIRRVQSAGPGPVSRSSVENATSIDEVFQTNIPGNVFQRTLSGMRSRRPSLPNAGEGESMLRSRVSFRLNDDVCNDSIDYEDEEEDEIILIGESV